MARRSGRRLLTLTSDVGAAYTAQMKAVLLRTVRPEQLVDLTHDLRPHAIGEAAFVLRAMARGFPPGTVHLVVVDPGVGGRRAGVAIACKDGSYLVGPDNGVLYPLAEALGLRRAVRLEPTRFAPHSRVGATFDGRDLFAPAAALLARGAPISRLGPPHVATPLRIPRPVRRPGGADGEVVHVDRFGNLLTNVPTDWVPRGARRVSLRVGRRPARSLPFVGSYEALGRRRLGVLGSSFGLLELAVALGRAESRLGIGFGAAARFRWNVELRARDDGK